VGPTRITRVPEAETVKFWFLKPPVDRVSACEVTVESKRLRSQDAPPEAGSVHGSSPSGPEGLE
jgi:hypothetical protein